MYFSQLSSSSVQCMTTLRCTAKKDFDVSGQEQSFTSLNISQYSLSNLGWQVVIEFAGFQDKQIQIHLAKFCQKRN